MIDAEPLIDDEVLYYRLLARDLDAADDVDDVYVTAAVDVDENHQITLPFVTFTTSGDGQLANGAGVWDSVLTLSCVAEGLDAAKALAQTCYRIVHAWSDPTTSRIDGIGGVIDVVDQSRPSRQPAALAGAAVLVQYDAVYAIQLRS